MANMFNNTEREQQVMYELMKTWFALCWGFNGANSQVAIGASEYPNQAEQFTLQFPQFIPPKAQSGCRALKITAKSW